MKLLYTLLSLSILFNINLSSQQIIFHPYNLDFEIGSPPSMPYSWEITNQSVEFEYYALSNDEEVFSGKRSLILFNHTPYKEGMYGSVYQRFDANRYRGKKVRFSANLKTEFPNDTSNVRLYINEYNEQNKSNQIEQMIDDPITSANWDSFSVEMDISKFAHSISIGVVLLGNGVIYMDNAKVEIIENYNYSLVNNFKLNDNQKNNILALAKSYGLSKYFQSSSEIQSLNKYNFIRYGIDKVINSDNLSNELNQLFKNVSPAIKFSEINTFANKVYDDESIDKVALLYKHRVGYNDCYPTTTKTEAKNVFQPDKTREGLMLKYIKHNGLEGKELVFSAKVKTKLKNVYSNAQLWMRIIRDGEDDINIYMFDNPITTTDWKTFQISQVIPENTLKITIGCVLIGDGDAWFDDVTISVNEKGKLINLENGIDNFDELKNMAYPKDWIIPNTVNEYGYDLYVDNTNSSSGKNSLKITTEKSLVINYPSLNEFYTEKINDKLFINFPKYLLINEVGTIPNSKTNNYNEFIQQIDNHNLNEYDFYSKIGILVDIYSYVKYFYILENKGNELDLRLKESIDMMSDNIDTKIVIKYFLSIFDDTQMKVWKKNDENLFSFPFKFEKYGNDYIITEIYNNFNKLELGDKLLSVNGIKIEEYINKELVYENGLNEVNKINKVLARLLIGDSVNVFDLKFEGKFLKINRNLFPSEYLNTENIDMMKPNDEIIYINMSMVDDKFFKFLAKELGEIKGFIFDARGNTLLSEHFLGYFLKNDVKTNQTKIPYIIEPERDRINYEIIQPFLNKLDGLNKNVVFLIDENTVGYTEFVMGLVKYYEIGTLIGRQTAGMPHDIVSVPLPLDYNFSMSVFNVSNPKGDNISFKMIEPDVKVEKVFIGDDDLILKEAVNYLNTKLKSTK